MADEEMIKATVEEASLLIAALKKSLLSKVAAADWGSPSKIPFKAISLRELLLHRIVDLSASAVDLYSSGKPVAAIIITRAVIETVSILYVLCAKVEGCVRHEDVDQFDEDVMKMLFGNRVEMEVVPVAAVNVLSHIDKMNKKFEGVRWWYDQLSEIAHPNLEGLFGVYGGGVEQPSLTLLLGVGGRAAQSRGDNLGLPALCFCLEAGIDIYNLMVEPFLVFQDLCHRKLREQQGQK
jgi:hypothetical protein